MIVTKEEFKNKFKGSNTKELEDRYGIKVRLLEYTDKPEELITFAALISFWEEWDGDKFYQVNENDVKTHLPKLMMAGHHSILEHAKVTFVIEGCSRVCLAQITRHRLASFTVQSQRFVKIDEPDYFVVPEDLKGNDKYSEFTQKSFELYRKLVDENIPKEDARFVFPQGVRTKLIVTANFREWLHILSLRMCYHAQWEIRDISWAIWEQLMKIAPHVFIHAVPKCIKFGYCPDIQVDEHLYCGVMDKVVKRYIKTMKELGYHEDDLLHKSFFIINRRKKMV